MKNIVLSLSIMFGLCLSACKSSNVTSTNDCIDKSKIKETACIQIYQPVCGCDGKTYANTCFAENAGVTSWTEGECK